MKKIRNKHGELVKRQTLKNENHNKKAKVTSIESLICNDKKNQQQ